MVIARKIFFAEFGVRGGARASLPALPSPTPIVNNNDNKRKRHVLYNVSCCGVRMTDSHQDSIIRLSLKTH